MTEDEAVDASLRRHGDTHSSNDDLTVAVSENVFLFQTYPMVLEYRPRIDFG